MAAVGSVADKPPTVNYVLAVSTPWGEALFDRLSHDPSATWSLVRTPDELVRAAENTTPRYIFFPHWSQRIPRQVWIRHECVIFHMTDLPYGRGGSPLQNLILRGRTATMISAFRCNAELDAGDVYLKRPLGLDGAARDIFSRAMVIVEGMIAAIIRDQPIPMPQTGDPVRFKRRLPQDSELPTVTGIAEAYDFIRMLDADGYPPAFVRHGSMRLEFSDAQLHADRVEARVIIRLNDPCDAKSIGSQDSTDS